MIDQIDWLNLRCSELNFRQRQKVSWFGPFLVGERNTKVIKNAKSRQVENVELERLCYASIHVSSVNQTATWARAESRTRILADLDSDWRVKNLILIFDQIELIKSCFGFWKCLIHLLTVISELRTWGSNRRNFTNCSRWIEEIELDASAHIQCS